MTPGSSLAKGDWGLKRPLPAKSTSEKSSRPVVRVVEHDTFEHVTDFESASDHVMTLEKFQDLHMPISLLQTEKSSRVMRQHESPFEAEVDNTHESEGQLPPNAKQFRQAGPSLARMTEAEFQLYMRTIRNRQRSIQEELRRRIENTIIAQRKKQAQDNGEDLEAAYTVKPEEIDAHIKRLRAHPSKLGPMIYNLLDLPSSPPVPEDRMHGEYYEAPETIMPTSQYAYAGPPTTHPSAGLSYQRTHTYTYNHPHHGPQAFQRPVEARVLRPKTRLRSRAGRSVMGVAGIASDDMNSIGVHEDGAPPGLQSFDATVPGGAKYYMSPVRAFVNGEGKVSILSQKATANTKAAYGVEDYRHASSTSIPEAARGRMRTIARLDRPRFDEGVENATKSLMGTIGRS